MPPAHSSNRWTTTGFAAGSRRCSLVRQSRARYYDVTARVQWFAGQIAAACPRTSQVMDRAIDKSRFWVDHSATELDARQRKGVRYYVHVPGWTHGV